MAEPYMSNELPDVLKADAMSSEIMMDVDIETALIEPTTQGRYINGGRKFSIRVSK